MRPDAILLAPIAEDRNATSESYFAERAHSGYGLDGVPPESPGPLRPLEDIFTEEQAFPQTCPSGAETSGAESWVEGCQIPDRHIDL